jgi:hypothetical protein
MKWSRPWSVLTLCLCVAFGSLGCLQAQDSPAPAAQAKNQADQWLLDVAVTVTPRAAPVPALQYRLLPLSSACKEGNAVPIYERLGHERSDEDRRLLDENTDKWNKLALDKLPVAEAREYLSKWTYNLHQLDVGARRRTADWAYALDSGPVIEMLLPDMADMRRQSRLLALKARVEIAEGRLVDAIRTLETDCAFNRHVAETPFLICGLVAVSGAEQMAACTLDLMQRPEAPNLYWALTALPRPLIDLRRGYELEQRTLELQFPALAHLDQARSPEQWDAALARVRKEAEHLWALAGPEEVKRPKPGTSSTDPAVQAPDLPAAKKYLAATAGLSAERVDAMPPAQVLLLYLVSAYKELADDHYKLSYLPFPEAHALLPEAQNRLKAVPDTEPARLARALLPAIQKVLLAQVRLERKLAALRVIEALRLHAAAHDGQLPDKLSDVTVVPVPNDPGTDRPFNYRRDGDTAVLTSRIPDETVANGLRYRITVRK